MDLAKLNFHVETKALQDALVLVGKLGDAVQELGKDVQVLATADKNASAAALLQAKARRENAAALKEEGAAAERAAKASKQVADSTNQLSGAAGTAEGKVSAIEKVLNRYADKLEVLRSGNLTLKQDVVELGGGFTASQASALAMLKAMGATEDQLKSLSNTLKNLNDISGVNPFDASANGLSRLKKEVQELNRVNELSQRGFNITKDEVRLLSRDINALEQNYKAAGLSQEALAAATTKLTSDFVQQAQVRNTLVAQSQAMEAQAKAEAAALGMVGQQLFDIHQLKQRQNQNTYQSEMEEMRNYYSAMEKQSQGITKSTGEMDEAVRLYHLNQQKESAKTAKALSYVEAEFSRAENALEGLNNDLQVSTSNRLLKFEQQLKQSGMAVADQTVLLDKYRATLTATDKMRAQKGHLPGRSESDKRVDLLARGLAPQISDVLVSLQGGMNPFTVLMQQGMQVRDLMQLSGVEAERMGDAFRKAGQGMVTTTVAAAGAIGNMLLGVVMDTGKAVTGLGLNILGLNKQVNAMQLSLAVLADQGTGLEKVVGRVGLRFLNLFPAVVGAAMSTTLVALVGLSVGLYKVIKEENELAKVLALNAGNLNMSQQAAIGYASSFDAVSTSTSKVIDVLQVMAKTSSFTRSEMDAVVTSALELQKYAGVAVEDTVKSFAKMKDEPVKALLELAKTTGMVPPAVQAAIIELERQGKTSEATALAVKTLADVNSQQVQRMKEDYNGFSLFMKELGASIANFFSSVFKDLFRKADPKKQMEQQLAALNTQIGSVKGNLKFLGSFGDNSLLKSLESQRDLLGEQIRMLDKGRRAEEDRAKFNIANAKLNAAAQDAYLSSLSDEEKHKLKIRDLDKQIAQARNLGNTNAAASFEKMKKFEEESFAKKNKEKKTPKSPEQRAEDSVYNKTLKDLEKLRDAAMKAEVAAMDYSDVQKAALDIFNDPVFIGYYDEAKKVWVGYTDQQKIALANEIELLYAQEMTYKTIQEAKKSSAEVVKSRNEQVGEAFKELQALEGSLKAQQEIGTILEFEASLSGLISTERQKQVEIKKIELDLEKQIAEIRSKNLSDAQKQDQIAVAQATAAQKIANVNTKFVNDLNQQLIDGVTDAIMTGLIEGGKAGRKSLRDLIVAELQKPIHIFIQAQISSIFGGGGGLGGLGGSFLQSALGDVGSKFLGSIGIGGSTLAAIGSSIAAGAKATLTGQSITGAAGAYSAAGQQGVSMGLRLGSNLPYAVGGSLAYRGISGGYEMDGAAKIFADAVGNFAGMMGPGGMFVSAVAGLFNRAFGRKLVGEGLSAQIQGGQVTSVGTYREEKGGWFRSDKMTRGEADPAQAKQLTKDFEALKYQAIGMSNALGLNSSAIENFSGELKVNYKGVKNNQEAAQRYNESMDKMYLEMLKASGGLDKFVRAGESVEDALKRMTEEANQLAQAAGYSSANLTDTLVKAMTGQMEEADVGAALGDIIVGSIYNALAMGFAEQITSSITGLIIQPIMTSILAGGSVTAAVSQASIDMIVQQASAAIEAFNQIISDPAFVAMISELNNMTMEIVGMSMQSVPHIQSFGSSMRSAADDAAEAAKKIADERFGLEGKLMGLLGQTNRLRQRELAELDATNRHLQEHIYRLEDTRTAYDAIVEAANETLDRNREARDAIKSVFDLLIENVRELRNEVQSTSSMDALIAQSVISTAISTKILPDQDTLQQAITSLKEELTNASFSSRIEADRARLLLSNDLSALSDISQDQLSKADRDIELLEATLKNNEQQLNALLGIQTYTFNTQEAISALGTALQAYSKAFAESSNAIVSAAINAPAAVAPSGGGGGGFGGFHSPAPQKVWTASGYAAKNPDLVAHYNENSSRRGWPKELNSLDAYLQWHWNNQGQNEKRQFAKGGAFTNGIVSRPTMFNIGEMGEAGSEAIMPLSNIGGSLGVRAVMPDMSEAVEELQALRSEVVLLRAETRAVATHTAKLYGLIDDVTQDGNELRVNVINTPDVNVVA